MSLIIHSSAEGFKSHELLAISVPLPTQIFANYLQLVYLILESSVLSKMKPCCLLLQIVLFIFFPLIPYPMLEVTWMMILLLQTCLLDCLPLLEVSVLINPYRNSFSRPKGNIHRHTLPSTGSTNRSVRHFHSLKENGDFSKMRGEALNPYSITVQREGMRWY